MLAAKVLPPGLKQFVNPLIQEANFIKSSELNLRISNRLRFEMNTE
jgi:hypothetical protein